MTNDLINELYSVRDWVRWGASEFVRSELFFGHGTDNAWDEAAYLVLSVIQLPWERLPDLYETRLTSSEKNAINTLFLERIRTRKPAPYLTGEAWFAGLKFKVNEHVLVPRSPIAELIMQEFQPWLTEYPERILDLCTGSGCLGVLCARAFEHACVDISDISPDALAVARENVALHAMDDRVRVIESDLFSSQLLMESTYDLIVSNPPYVDAADIDSMPAEYRAEPALALASGRDGLDITRQILKKAARYLAPGGLLVVEVGNSCTALEHAYPEVSFIWPEFEHGGHGVFVLTHEQLSRYENQFAGV